MTDRGRERDPPPEQEAAAGTAEKTEEGQNNVDTSGQAAGLHHNVDQTEQEQP